MKKIILIITMSIISLSNIFAASAFDAVVAQVKLTKTHLIKLSYVEEKIKSAEAQIKREFSPEEKDFILDSIISNELLKQAAKRDGVVVTEEMILAMLKKQVGQTATDQQVKNAISKQYNKPWDEVSAALIDQLTLQEYIKIAGAEDLKKYATAPTESEITKFYNSNKTKFVNPDMVRVNHIFFSTQGKTDAEINDIKKKADSALVEIKQGKKSFDELVQNVSDDRNSAKNGGELGFVSRDEAATVQILGMDFINRVFDLSMDEIHGVLKSNSGFHIVQITEKRSARILKLTDPINPTSTVTVGNYIAQQLQQQKVTQGFSQVTELVISRVKEDAVIKIIEKSLPWK